MEDTSEQEPVDKLDMTDEQWAWFQKATHGYGDQDENGIDLSLLRENLKLTPTERLERNQGALRFFLEVRRIAPEPDFATLLRALGTANVRWVLIGGLAMVAHGSAHVTDDLDLAFGPNEENRRALAAALAPFQPMLRGDSRTPPALDAFLSVTPNVTLCTTTGPVDLFGLLSGIHDFEALWERSSVVSLYGVSVRVAALDDLIAMKRAAGRLKDQNHVLELEALKKLENE